MKCSCWSLSLWIACVQFSVDPVKNSRAEYISCENHWALEGTCILLLINDRNELNELIGTKEKLSHENHWSMTQQMYVVSKLYFARAVFLGKRDFLKSLGVCVCVWGGGHVFGSIVEYFPLLNINFTAHPRLYSRFLAPVEYFAALWMNVLCLEGAQA